MITDEMVAKAENAYYCAWCAEEGKTECLRAALEAVVPMLIEPYQQSLNVLAEQYERKCEEVLKARAGGMREAAGMVHDINDHITIHRRAQELDPR